MVGKTTKIAQVHQLPLLSSRILVSYHYIIIDIILFKYVKNYVIYNQKYTTYHLFYLESILNRNYGTYFADDA